MYVIANVIRTAYIDNFSYECTEQISRAMERGSHLLSIAFKAQNKRETALRRLSPRSFSIGASTVFLFRARQFGTVRVHRVVLLL
jgi:hypothetical protein